MSLDLPAGALSRTLSDKGGADKRALALKLFSGTVLEAFRAKTVFYDNTGSIMLKKTIEGGHMYQWPIIGDDIVLSDIGTPVDDAPTDDIFDSVTASGGLRLGYHTPGDFISGQEVKVTEATVRVDDMLVGMIDVPFQDLDLSHFDVLQPFATKIGRSLAIDNDKKIATIALKAARTAADAGIHQGGQVVDINVTTPTSLTNAFADDVSGSRAFRDGVAELARKFDEDHVPEDGRYLFVPPYIRQLLRHEGTGFGSTGSDATIYGPAGNIYSKDQNSNPWDLNTRSFGMLEGFNLVVSTHLPDGTTQGKFNAVDTNLAKYDYVADGTSQANGRVAAIALCGAQEGTAGVGMVQAGGIRSVIEDDERRNVKMLKSQMLVGYDVIAPWCAGVIQVY